MNNIIKFQYNGEAISFNKNGWINATVAAAKFGKRPVDWLKQDSTKEYIRKLAVALNKSNVQNSHNTLVTTHRGNSEKSGTWLHPKLAVAFARWLSVDFEIWCDLYLDTILFGDITKYENYQKACEALEAAQKEASKCGSGLAKHRWQKPSLVHSVGYWHDQLELPFLRIV